MLKLLDMVKEIERKYLVIDDSYRDMAIRRVGIMQGYLSTRKEATVRVRLCGDCGYITVKGPNSGAVRDEWEYAVPADDAREMLTRLATGIVVDKTRHIVEFDGLTWEIDEFHGALSGLVVAEVELPSEDTAVALPRFVGQEVTGDPRYYNSNLALQGAPHSRHVGCGETCRPAEQRQCDI